MTDAPIASLQNPRVKEVVKLRQRSHRDAQALFIVEGYRELKRALDNGRRPVTLFACEALFLGKNEPALIEQCRQTGAEIVPCTPPVFEKMAYRERPEGLLAILPQVHLVLANLKLPERPLLIVAEAIEKPGNLGTILRSADAAGASAVIVCDQCTDIHNPNVVRASTGALFSRPVVETSSVEALTWLRHNKIQILAASPHAEKNYTDVDLRAGTAFQQVVWRMLQTIPYGETRSYAWVARQIGKPKATRAVGAACGANPVPIVVPCHRVVGSDGSLGGFSGGLALKRRLLALEGQ